MEIDVFSEEIKEMKKKEKKRKENLKKYLQIFLTIVYSILYFWVFCCVGLITALPGVTKNALRDLTSTSDDNISILFTCRGVGSIIGTLLSGPVYNLSRTNLRYVHLILSISLFINSAGMFVIPFVPFLWVCFVAHFLQGIMISFHMVGVISSIMVLYKKNLRSALLQAIHAFLGFGGVLTFLVSIIYHKSKHVQTNMKIIYSFAGVVLFIPIPFFVVLCCCRNVKRKKKKEETPKDPLTSRSSIVFDHKTSSDEDEETDGFKDDKEGKSNLLSRVKDKVKSQDRKDARMRLISCGYEYGISFVVCMFGLVAAFISNTIFSLIPTFFENKGIASKDNAPLSASAYWGGFTLARFICIFITLLIKPYFLIWFNLVSLLLCFVLMAVFSNVNVIIWIGVVFIGLFLSPIVPGMYVIPSELYGIKLNAIQTSMIILGQSLAMEIPTLLTYLDNNLFGDNGLIYSNIYFVVNGIFIYFFLFFGGTVFKCAERFARIRKNIVDTKEIN